MLTHLTGEKTFFSACGFIRPNKSEYVYIYIYSNKNFTLTFLPMMGEFHFRLLATIPHEICDDFVRTLRKALYDFGPLEVMSACDCECGQPK